MESVQSYEFKIQRGGAGLHEAGTLVPVDKTIEIDRFWFLNCIQRICFAWFKSIYRNLKQG